MQIRKQRISKKRMSTELDCSTGLSYNGTTTSVAVKGLNGEITVERFFMDEGERLSDSRKRAMVENEDLILAMTPDTDKEKAKNQIAKWREELNLYNNDTGKKD